MSAIILLPRETIESASVQMQSRNRTLIQDVSHSQSVTDSESTCSYRKDG